MSRSGFLEMLTGLTTGFTPVVDAGFSLEEYAWIDLSVKNAALTAQELSSAEAFQRYLSSFLGDRNKKVAWGGYNEQRGLYRRSGLFSASEEQGAVRNMHLGIDIWCAAGTDVLSVLRGKIHSFRDNVGLGDYGPTIVLEHSAKKANFYTLYGHLARKSLGGLKEGQEIAQGQKIGELGEPSENGEYAPHLHFQVIKDLEGRKGDYPGVAAKNVLEYFLDNCPDPNLLLKIP